MPVLTSPDIAHKFKEKWLTVYPGDQINDSAPLDDSLTSLHWLQNFSILSADTERPNGAGQGCPSSQQDLSLKRPGFPRGGNDSPSSPTAGDTATTGMPVHIGCPVTSGSDSTTALWLADCAHLGSGYAQIPQIPIQASPPVEVDYKTNSKVKPPYSYASLICMAMQASKQPKVTLSTIYNWITENFCYYRHAEPSWQNSIRHNLSLNKCFKKVPRQKDEPGKGGFWQIDPLYADMFVNGIFKRRRMSANSYNSSSNSTQRQSKQSHGFHRTQNGCPHQSGSKRKHLATKNKIKAMSATVSPLLATDANKAEILRGDFDLASVFDDVLSGNCSTFEDLDINTALSSLGCEMEVSMQGRQHSAGLVRWCGGGDLIGQSLHQNHHQSYSYIDVSAVSQECLVNMGELHVPQQHPQVDHDQLLQSHHHPLQQFDETSTLFPERPEETVLQPWEEIKEEAHAIPLTLDQGFGLCEGFFTEMQPWERVEAYM